jgi:PAS domain S-box-containing protein
MQISVESKINLGFGIALLTLSAVSIASYWSTTHLVQATGWVAHSREVLDELDDVPLQLARAEIAHRTYLLTGDEQPLAAYYIAKTATQKEIADVRTLTTDHPAQQQRLNDLQSRIQERFAGLENSISFKKHQDLNAAEQEALKGERGQTEKDIQGQIETMETKEQTVLQQRLLKAAQSAIRTRTTIGVSSSFAIGIVILASILVRRDLLKRTRAEAALHASEERYRSLVETARDGIVTVTVDGTITKVNQALETLVQWPREEILGRHYREMLTPASAARWEDRLRHALAVERLPSMYETELVRKDGRIVPVEVQASFLRDKDGNPSEILALFRDVTRRGSSAQLSSL